MKTRTGLSPGKEEESAHLDGDKDKITLKGGGTSHLMLFLKARVEMSVGSSSASTSEQWCGGEEKFSLPTTNYQHLEVARRDEKR